MAFDLPLPKVVADVEAGGPYVTAAKGMNQLHKLQLENTMQQLQNKYYGPTQEGKIANQLLENKWYEPKAKSAIALQDAQTGHYPYLNAHTAAQTNKLNMMTPLEAQELALKNKFYPEVTKQGIESDKALANYRASGGAGMGVGAKDDRLFQNNVALDNPQLKTPEQIREAANVYSRGGNALADGTPLNPMTSSTERALDRAIKGGSTAALITKGVTANQAEAELQVLGSEASKFIKPYGTTYLNKSPEAIMDSFKNDEASQTKLGKLIAGQALQYEASQIRNRIAGGEPGISATHELMGKSKQIIDTNFPRLSGMAREVAAKTIDDVLHRALQARQKVGIHASQLERGREEPKVHPENIGAPPKQAKITTDGRVLVRRKSDGQIGKVPADQLDQYLGTNNYELS
jgi:hypothetical protein